METIIIYANKEIREKKNTEKSPLNPVHEMNLIAKVIKLTKEELNSINGSSFSSLRILSQEQKKS